MHEEEIEPTELIRAKQYVYRILNIRLRSCKEIEDKLAKRNYSKSVIKQTLKYFHELALINDQQFARLWISSRLNKPYGINRIKAELKRKGVNPEILENEINIVFKNYDEINIINQLIAKKNKQYSKLSPDKQKQRLYAYLIRRGFSQNSIIETINKLQ
ncbi:MAG: regulatory protein RecX [Candidatus Omnitrophica bacterium]|nr:regulatory protein RecX [Candidatus Omnitrophota bacterium]